MNQQQSIPFWGHGLRLGLFLLCFIPISLAATCTGTITYSGGGWDFAAWGGSSPLDPVVCDVVIPAGPQVYLGNTDLYLAADVEITVEVGATFLMQRCTLQAVAPEASWTGFKVKGDPTLSATATGQTRVFMRWNELRNMEDGFVLGDGSYSTNLGGAVLTCEENTFHNNEEGIQVLEYTDFPSAVKIRNNTFSTDNTPLSDPNFWFASGRYVLIINAFNVVVEDNQFGNLSPASVGSNEIRGAGIMVAGGSVLARNNQFYRLDEGIHQLHSSSTITALTNPLFNATRVESCQFYNNEAGIFLSEGPMNIFDNDFIVDDNNVLSQDRYDQGNTQRDYSGVRMEGDNRELPIDDINIQNNRFTMGETLPYDEFAETLSLLAIHDFGGTQPGDDVIIRNNVFTFDVPFSSVISGGMQYVTHGIHSRTGEADYEITCNEFNHTAGNTSNNLPIKIFFRDEPLSFGSVGLGAGNVFPPCSDVGDQIWMTGTITADYYEVTGLNGVDPTCYFGTVNYPATNVTNTCAVQDPPAFIPFSIEPTQYPGSSKAAAQVDPVPTFKAYPNPVTNHRLHIELSEVGGELRLLDLTGRALLIHHPEQLTTHLNLSDVPAGIYLVEYQFKGQKMAQRLIVR